MIEKSYENKYDLTCYLDEETIYKLLNGLVPIDNRILSALSYSLVGHTDFQKLIFGDSHVIHDHLNWFITNKINFSKIILEDQKIVTNLLRRLLAGKELTRTQLNQLIYFEIVNFPRKEGSYNFQQSFDNAIKVTGIKHTKSELKYSDAFMIYQNKLKKSYFKDKKHDKATLLTLTFIAEILFGIKHIF